MVLERIIFAWNHTLILTFLDLLGWDHARDGSKAKPFFDVLGMSINLSKLSSGVVVLSNKKSRVERIVAMLHAISERGFVEFHESQVLHGLMNYAGGFFSGRTLKGVCAQALQLGRLGDRASLKMVRNSCACAKELLSSLRPRELRLADALQPVLSSLTGLGSRADLASVP